MESLLPISPRPTSPTRRRFLATLAGTAAVPALMTAPVLAQEAANGGAAEQEGTPFSFDWLTERMREAATKEPAAPETIGGKEIMSGSPFSTKQIGLYSNHGIKPAGAARRLLPAPTRTRVPG